MSKVSEFLYDAILMLFLFGLVIPSLATIFGIDSLTRAISLEVCFYLKSVQWLYKYVLTVFDHGFALEKNSSAAYIVYGVGLFALYIWIIPSVGNIVKEKCWSNRCHMYGFRETKVGPFSYTIDLSDSQWKDLRSNLPLLAACAFFMVVGHKAVNSGISGILSNTNKGRDTPPSTTTDISSSITSSSSSSTSDNDNDGGFWLINLQRARRSAVYHMWTGLLFLCVQHGWHAVLVWLLCSIVYQIARLRNAMSAAFVTILVWIACIIILVLKESYRVQFWPGYEFLQLLFDRSYGGLYGWQLPANFLVLRLISFCVDAIRSTSSATTTSDSGSGNGNEFMKYEVDPHSSGWSLPRSEYSYTNFMAYMLYPPLYIGGPITSFNAFIYYLHAPQRSEVVWKYALRWLGALLLLEAMLHFFPFFAVVKSGFYPYLSIQEMVVVGYTLLKMMWLKFLIIWRFFRLWAIADGQCPPENMERCMSNNHSIGGFWRGWHSSFNKWILRYIYLPLGGKTWKYINVWPIFLFVALWHDVEPHLLAWACLNSGFLMIENTGSWIAKRPWFTTLSIESQRGWKVSCGAAYIIILVGVNLIGYAFGIGGITAVYEKICTLAGLRTITGSFIFLSIGVCIMNSISTHKKNNKSVANVAVSNENNYQAESKID